MPRLVYLMLCLLFVGCSGNASTGPATFPVTGKLTVGGKPVPDVTVQLIPLDPANAGAAGKTDSSGYFSVTATNGQSGAVNGKYKVVLQAAQGMNAAQYTGGAGGPPKPAALPFPAEYSSAGSTPKEVEVQGKSTTLDITL